MESRWHARPAPGGPPGGGAGGEHRAAEVRRRREGPGSPGRRRRLEDPGRRSRRLGRGTGRIVRAGRRADRPGQRRGRSSVGRGSSRPPLDRAGARRGARLGERTILHCGPSLPWPEFCDPLRRSVRAAVTAEGWASSPDEAERLVATGEVSLASANRHATSVPMASAIRPSAPVFVAENPQSGDRAYSGINQGPGETPWFGVESPAAVDRLVFLREAVAPVLDAVVRSSPRSTSSRSSPRPSRWATTRTCARRLRPTS